MKRWRNKFTPKSNDQSRREKFLPGNIFFITQPATGAISTANKMECVNPRWASRLSGWFIHPYDTTSISGRLLAIAPHSMAFLPSFFPPNASPTQAPKNVWVSESKWNKYQNAKKVKLILLTVRNFSLIHVENILSWLKICLPFSYIYGRVKAVGCTATFKWIYSECR